MTHAPTGDSTSSTGTRAPTLQYQGKNGFALSHYPGPVTEDSMEVDEAEPTTQAALDAHLAAQFVISQKVRPIPTFDQMKEELNQENSSSIIKQRISDLKEQHLSDLEKLYAWHAEEYLYEAEDRYLSKDDLMYLSDGENNPVLKEGYAQLERLYDDSRKNIQHQPQWEDDLERMRHSHLVLLTGLYADLKKQEAAEEELKRIREAQFPTSIEDYNSKPKDVQLRAARFLTLNDEARQEKMLTEFGWAWRQVKPLQEIYDKDPAFKGEVMASLIEVRDPRKRL